MKKVHNYLIYDNHKKALSAAKRFQKKNGGKLFDEVKEELVDDNNRIVGTYGAVVVGTGQGTEPFGDSWEEFYYSL